MSLHTYKGIIGGPKAPRRPEGYFTGFSLPLACWSREKKVCLTSTNKADLGSAEPTTKIICGLGM